MKLKDTIISAVPTYTGGGFYLITGQFADGTFFVADNDHYDITRVDADYYLVDWDEEIDWFEDHTIEYISPTSEMFRNICGWIFDNHPDGNYLMGDIVSIYNDIDKYADKGAV